MAVEQKGKVTK